MPLGEFVMRTTRLVLALSALWVTTVSAKDVYKNPTAGFEVTKPKGWHYETAEQLQGDLKAIKIEDQEFRAALLKYATVPMVAMTKHEEPYDDVNPSFKVNMRPAGQLKDSSAVAILNCALPQLQRFLKDSQLVQPPSRTEVSGLEAAYARVDFSMEMNDGRSYPTSSEFWIIPRGDYFFMIGAGTRQDEKTGTRKEIQDIMKTVKIEH